MSKKEKREIPKLFGTLTSIVQGGLAAMSEKASTKPKIDAIKGMAFKKTEPDSPHQARIQDMTQEQIALELKRGMELEALSPYGIVTFNSGGFVTSINPAFAALSGFSEKEIVGRHLKKIGTLRHQKIDDYQQLFEKVIKGGLSGPIEFNYHKKDGTPCIGEAHIALIKDGTRVKGLQTILIDITKKREKEKEIERKSKYLEVSREVIAALSKSDSFDKVAEVIRDGLDLGSVLVGLLDKEKNTMRPVGLSLSSIVPAPVYTMVKSFEMDHDSNARARDFFANLNSFENVTFGELTKIASGGNRIADMVARIANLVPKSIQGPGLIGPLIDSNQGKMGCLLVVCRPGETFDATERALIHSLSLSLSISLESRVAQEKRNKNYQDYRAIFEGAGVGIATASTDLSLTVIDVNPTLLEISGLKREELVGHSGMMLIPKFLKGQDASGLLQVAKNLVSRSEVPLHQQVAYVRPDGQKRILLLASTTVQTKESGKIVIIVNDITGRKQAEQDRLLLEEQLHQAQKMEAIGQLAGGIAHDINNVLGAIFAFCELIQKELEEERNIADIEGDLDEIINAVQRGRDLTFDVLSFSRFEPRNIKQHDLGRIIETDLGMIARIAADIRIDSSYEEGLWPVDVDESRISTAIMNLLNNAVDAAKSSLEKHTTVEARNVTISSNDIPQYSDCKPGKYVVVRVSDTGEGISSKTKKKIFDPFFTTKPKGKGTGLGLSTVYGTVQNHNGFVTVESEEGIGSTFAIYLPASLGDKTKEQRPSQDLLTFGNETILLVDDDPAIRRSYRRILQGCGYTIIEASNGSEAMEIYEKEGRNIGLVLLDMMMPDKGGYDTFFELKKKNKDVKVIISTGYSEGEAQELLEKGALGLIKKPPQDWNRVKAKIRRTLDVN